MPHEHLLGHPGCDLRSLQAQTLIGYFSARRIIGPFAMEFLGLRIRDRKKLFIVRLQGERLRE